MSKGTNLVLLVGNVGGDAELAYTQGGTPYMKFGLATSETWKDKEGERQEKTTWHNIIMWGKRAEGLAPHVRKGDIVSVQGKIDINEYEDREGVKRKGISIVIHNLDFVYSKKRGDGDAEPQEPRGPSRQQQRAEQKQQQRSAAQRPAPSGDPPDEQEEGWGDGPPEGGDDIPF